MRFLRRIFTIKEVPSVSWSSDFPLNTKPGSYTVIVLITGLFFFGLGEAIIIGSGSGVSPWTVLAQGISIKTDLSVGTTTFLYLLGKLLYPQKDQSLSKYLVPKQSKDLRQIRFL